MTAPARDRPTGGFTLVELLTVMGILGILVALVVGAAHGIRQHAARTETLQTLRAIQAGLSKYYDDWHKYPWYDDEDDHPLMGMVREGDRYQPGYRPLESRDLRADKGDPAAACLYASLAMGERNGPYCAGAGGNVETLPYEDDEEYMVFVDGWGRPIHYFPPPPNPDAPTSDSTKAEYYMGTPLLMSEGPQKDMPDVDDTKEDNVYNYPVSSPPADDEYYQ